MTLGELVIVAFLTFLSGGMGTLFWSRLNRLENRMGNFEARMTDLATRTEVHEGLAAVRAEIAGLRSDLTQVALAVGARPPRASEG